MYTDPAQHLVTTGWDLDAQDRDVYYTDPAQHLVTAG